MAKRNYAIQTRRGEIRLGRNRWEAAIDGKYLVRLNARNAELAPDVSLVQLDGAWCLCRATERAPYVLTNWVLIRRKNPAPSEVTQ